MFGVPQLRLLDDVLHHLRQAYDHPNRKLFFDDLLVAMLLAFFNPVARSLRGVEDASQMPGVNRHLDIEALKRSTTSDALALFDPDLLLPLIRDLRARISPRQADAADNTLRGLLNRLIAYDGSFFRTASDVAWALCERHGKRLRGRVRLNLHLSVRDGLPVGVSVAGQDDPSEPMAILDHVQPGQIVVADRGCFSHDTVHELGKQRVDFVLRLQSSVRCEVIAQRVLTQADVDAGVLSDQTVLLTGGKNAHAPTPLRLVTIRPTGDSTRVGAAGVGAKAGAGAGASKHHAAEARSANGAGGAGDAEVAKRDDGEQGADDALGMNEGDALNMGTGDGQDAIARDETSMSAGDAPDMNSADATSAAATVASTGDRAATPLRLLTSVGDEAIPAWMVGQLYRRRWDIELFFRWLKTCARWEHLLSDSRNGMLTQFYVALIGTLLLAIATGRKPDKYGFNMMTMIAAGLGSVEDGVAILQRRHAERDRDKQRRAERAAKKTS